MLQSIDEFINIDIELESTDDIFDKFFFTPLKIKNLNEDIEKYILRVVKRYSMSKKVKLNLHIRRAIPQREIDELEKDLRGYFLLKAKELDMELKQRTRDWFMNMIIGMLFLVLCLIIVEILDAFSYIYFIKVLKEGILIIDWVALWEPVTFSLFGRRAIKRDRQFYYKLNHMPIIVEQTDARNKKYRY